VSACPSEETLLAFVRGELGGADLSALDAHVDGCRACRGLLAALADGERPPGPAGAARLPDGAVVAGRYRIHRFLGRGGMGEVYEAEDGLLGGERIALKTVAASLAEDATAVRRLRREVSLARRITHPNVCRIFDLGQADVPVPHLVFLTMELLPGETLRRRLRARGRLAPAAAWPVLVQVAAGLEAAHRAGVIHRDFKSGNVLLVSDPAAPGGERAVVTDFGLARAAAAGGPGLDSVTTGAGALIGTVTHAAPEQLRGQPLTPAADVHALGVVLYEMVTGGLLPFTGDTPADVIARRLRGAPPSPRAAVPDLDPRWEAAILRCLERDPGARFPSAAAVAAALDGAR
jgi:serine/threonine protein kinase